MMVRKRPGLLCGTFLFGCFLQGASAAPISGTFNMSGTFNVTGTGASSFSTITWNSDMSPFTASMFTLTASAIGTNESGQNGIATLINPPEVVGGTFAATPFIAFLAVSGLPALDINFINAGTGGTAGCSAPAAVNETCTFAGSLFTYKDDSADTSDVKFDLSGVTSDGLSTWNGIFTAQFPETYQALLVGSGPTGTLSNSYSGTVTVTALTATPEPATWLLAGLCLSVVVALCKYRQTKLVRRGQPEVTP
jgi:hypothetical protein